VLPSKTERFFRAAPSHIGPRLATAAVTAGLAAAALLVGAAPAAAATCNSPVRYAASSDTVYLTAAGPIDTLSEIKAACPSAPLVQPSPGIWELNADLVLQNGAKLTMDAAGDVRELRMQSLPSGRQNEVSALTAQYGQINIRGVKVTSWNGTGPDTDYAVPSGGVRGRAFIRALSVLEGSTPRQSTMNIENSDLGYLGFNGAEAYGVAYKARGCGVDTPAVCATLNVLGKQVGSRFHDNFMGTYTWGAQDMLFDRNTYSKNKSYGLDPHDDSDFLTITNNVFSDNGNHGLICSQRCDHLVIRGNKSTNNGLVPYVGPGDTDPSDNQVHGIMLHRGISDTVVENNEVTGQRNGGGIVIFDSVGNTVRGNTVSGNKYGLRFSVGTRDAVIENNTVTNSLTHALYTYKGSDTPVYTGKSGRPTNITFTGNSFTGAGAELFKVGDADRFTFSGGSFAPGAPARGPRFDRAQGHVINGSVSVPAGTTFTLRGTSETRTSLEFRGRAASTVVVNKDAYSTVTFSSP
jgi:mannuronan 5-epimerase